MIRADMPFMHFSSKRQIEDFFRRDRVFTLVIFFVALVLGCTFAWITPPFSVPDEGAHYLRTFEVSRGHWVNTRGNIGVPIPCRDYLIIAKQYSPVAFYQSAAEGMQPNASDCIVSSINTAGTYSPVPYMTAAVGMRIAEKMGTSVQTRLKFARIANAIATSLICFFAVLFVQRYRLLLASLVLLSMSMWLRSSLSADAVTIAMSITYLAYLLRIVERNDTIKLSNIAILGSFAIFLGSVKPVYGLLTFSSLLLFENIEESHSSLTKILILTIPGVAGLSTGLLWIWLADPALVYINNFGGADPAMQWQFIFSHPIEFFQIAFSTLYNNGDLFIAQAMVPTPSATPWLSDNASVKLGWLLISTVLFTMLTTRITLTLYQRIALIAVSLICILAVILPLYLTYTLVGHKQVIGLQGRYFLPIFFYAVVAGCANCKIMSSLSINKSLQLFVVLIVPMIIGLSILVYYFL